MIIIQVSAKLDGLGDFAFCLKLAEFLNECMEYHDDVYIVTTNPGAEARLLDLYNEEDYPSIHILNRAQYQTMFPDSKSSAKDEEDLLLEDANEEPLVKAYIRAPALTGLAKERLTLPSNQDCKVIVISEYGYSRKGLPFARNLLDDEDQREVILIDAGFGDTEKGILINKKLARISNPNVSDEEKFDLEMLFKERLTKGSMVLLHRVFGSADPDIHSYHQNSELSFAYFNKEGGDCRFDYLNMLTRVYDPGKNQDVVIMGGHNDKPIPNFDLFRDKLISDGFTKIVSVDSDGQEVVLYSDVSQTQIHPNEKIFRLLSMSPITPKQTEALLGLSNGRLCGTTGDQSFGDAISARKIPFYQVRKHKEHFAEDFVSQINKEADSEMSAVLTYCVSKESERSSTELPDHVSSTCLERWGLFCDNIHRKQDLGQAIYTTIRGEELVHSSAASSLSIEKTRNIKKGMADLKSSVKVEPEEQSSQSKNPKDSSGCGCTIS